jgi:hypothetical protein
MLPAKPRATQASAESERRSTIELALSSCEGDHQTPSGGRGCAYTSGIWRRWRRKRTVSLSWRHVPLFKWQRRVNVGLGGCVPPQPIRTKSQQFQRVAGIFVFRREHYPTKSSAYACRFKSPPATHPHRGNDEDRAPPTAVACSRRFGAGFAHSWSNQNRAPCVVVSAKANASGRR